MFSFCNRTLVDRLPLFWHLKLDGDSGEQVYAAAMRA